MSSAATADRTKEEAEWCSKRMKRDADEEEAWCSRKVKWRRGGSVVLKEGEVETMQRHRMMSIRRGSIV